MSFQTASAILRGIWLIDPGYARDHWPLIDAAMKARGEELESIVRLVATGIQTKRTESQVQLQTSTTQPVFSISSSSRLEDLPQGSIAVVSIIGPVTKYGTCCMTGTMEYHHLVQRLAACDNVAGILLNIDSPGGEVSGLGTLYTTIREAIGVKPVLAVIQDGVAASAAYYIASAAQEIYLTRPTDMVGSIGALIVLRDDSGALEQQGIKKHVIYAPQSTDKNKEFEDVFKGDDSEIKKQLSFCVEEFISAVKMGRGARLQLDQENPFTGKMYWTKEAKKIGLIDGQKSMAEVYSRMQYLIKLRNRDK